MQFNTVVYNLEKTVTHKSDDDVQLLELVTKKSTVKRFNNTWNAKSCRDTSWWLNCVCRFTASSTSINTQRRKRHSLTIPMEWKNLINFLWLKKTFADIADRSLKTLIQCSWAPKRKKNLRNSERKGVGRVMCYEVMVCLLKYYTQFGYPRKREFLYSNQQVHIIQLWIS